MIYHNNITARLDVLNTTTFYKQDTRENEGKCYTRLWLVNNSNEWCRVICGVVGMVSQDLGMMNKLAGVDLDS